jgi:hypothetical protein
MKLMHKNNKDRLQTIHYVLALKIVVADMEPGESQVGEEKYEVNPFSKGYSKA